MMVQAEPPLSLNGKNLLGQAQMTRQKVAMYKYVCSTQVAMYIIPCN